MFLKFVVIVQVYLLVECERLHFGTNYEQYENPEFVDSFGNEDEEKVIRDQRHFSEGRYGQFERLPLTDKMFPSSFEESAYHDPVNFHYPHVEFLTKDDMKSDFGEFQSSSNDNFFTQSYQVVEDKKHTKSTRKPKLKIYKSNSSNNENVPLELSHVQKVSKPITYIDENEKTKYEEISAESIHTSGRNSTKARINVLLKKYLAKLYSQKFNNTYEKHLKPTASLQLISKKEQEPQTKYFDNNLWSLKNEKIHKIKKLFSLFTIVQFNNSQCNATSSAGSYIGVCYTTYECSNLGGTAVGNCASGYGVCCVFRGTCGGFVSQNCSYFESPNYPDYYPSGNGVIVPTTIAPSTSTRNPSPTPDPRFPWTLYTVENRQTDNSLSCSFSVYKVNDMVSKMKIDFLDLELTGPTNGTCTNERLVISGQNTNARIPTICGYNTGQSIYVDVSTMTGPLQLMVLSNGSFKKRFRFRICQYADSCLEPTSNCLQYYTGLTGTISSFNYDQVSMLNRSVPGYFNNLNYAICIRREAGYCSITYTNVQNGVEYPFELRNVDEDGTSTLPRGIAGVDTIDCPDDYIVVVGTRLCGYKFNDGSNSNFTVNAPVTDTNAGPIVIPVRTNSAVTGLGFKIFYTQNRCFTS